MPGFTVLSGVPLPKDCSELREVAIDDPGATVHITRLFCLPAVQCLIVKRCAAVLWPETEEEERSVIEHFLPLGGKGLIQVPHGYEDPILSSRHCRCFREIVYSTRTASFVASDAAGSPWRTRVASSSFLPELRIMCTEQEYRAERSLSRG